MISITLFQNKTPQDRVDELANIYNSMEFNVLTNDIYFQLKQIKTELHDLYSRYPELEKPILKEYM